MVRATSEGDCERRIAATGTVQRESCASARNGVLGHPGKAKSAAREERRTMERGTEETASRVGAVPQFSRRTRGRSGEAAGKDGSVISKSKDQAARRVSNAHACRKV